MQICLYLRVLLGGSHSQRFPVPIFQQQVVAQAPVPAESHETWKGGLREGRLLFSV